MPLSACFGLFLVGTLIGLTIGWLAWGRYARSNAQKSEAQLIRIEDLTRERDDAMSHASQCLAHSKQFDALVEDLSGQLTQTTRERQDYQRRAEEYRSRIEGILKERDTWCSLYDEQSIAHGNAQAMMMSGLAELHHRLAAAGLGVEVPSIIREAHEEFVERHVRPALERSGIPRVRTDIDAPQRTAEKG